MKRYSQRTKYPEEWQVSGAARLGPNGRFGRVPDISQSVGAM